MAFGGIWQTWGKDEPQTTCAIVTTAANNHVSAVHHRMPLVIEPKDWALWLGEQGKGAATLMTPGDEDVLEYFRVEPTVNSNRASGADLIDPLDG